MKKLICTIAFTASTLILTAQCDEYYLSYYCRPSPQEAKDMKLSSQSKSAYVVAKETYNFQFILFGNMDYRIIFCAHESFYPIHYVLKNKKTGEVLFDNKDDEYVESISISIDETIPIVAEVTLLAEKAKFKDMRQDRTCIGIPIMYRRIPKLGF